MLLKDPCLRTTPGALVVLSLGLCACSPLDGSSWLGWRPGREGPAPHSGYEPPEPPDTPQFTQRIVVPELVTPWEITWGPDDQLWVTEREGPRVLRVDPATGAVAVAAEIPEVLAEVSQDGLLGLALHPRFLQGEGSDYVYVAYSYDADADPETVTKRTKLRRFTYNVETESLEDPFDLITGLPSSNDHNSGRLAIGPDGKLYYTIGDQGFNQYDYKCDEIEAQRLPTQAEISEADYSSYKGKILRLELDGAVPADNPLLAGVQSHVYSYGHRNAQGLAFGPNGQLYADEHGPKSDDELNWIRPGHNYGWPHVAGYLDDQAYVYANWSKAPDCETLEFSDYIVPPSVPVALESDFSSDFSEPLLTFFTVPADYDFTQPVCESQYLCWPTIAPSSLAYYPAAEGGIPGWGNSLLVTSLKHGAIFRVSLDAAGEHVVGEPVTFFDTTNRYRDLAISPDGQRIFVITDVFGGTQADAGGDTMELENRGAILEFRYVSAP